ncbi:MAG TPA: hydrogenase iron-sulfur subunit [bacterium]
MAKAAVRARKSAGGKTMAASKSAPKTIVKAEAKRKLKGKTAAATPAPRIVVFSCQWAPHYAFQSLYRRGRRGEGEAVRVMTACIGRVGEDLVLEAFRQGADGVAVLSCPHDLCRHGLDHSRFQARLGALRAILATLGIPAGHLLVGAFHPHEGERLAEEIERFTALVAADTAADRAPAPEDPQ